MIPENNIKQFKANLLYEELPHLIREGGSGFCVPYLYPKDNSDNFVIPVQRVIDFFFMETQALETLSSTSFFKSLYSLFHIFSKDIETFAFQAEERVSEKDIQKAGNRETIELLAKNLIISFFDQIRSYDGTINTSLVDKNLERLIKISNSGRDYRTLVENTLKSLENNLNKDQKWFDGLEHIKNAELVCMLVGEKLPQIDPSVLSNLFRQAGKEMEQLNLLLEKICRTKDQYLLKKGDHKNYVKSAVKLDQSLQKVLKQTNHTLSRVLSFACILKIEPGRILEKQEAVLYKNLATIFFGYRDQTPSTAAAGIRKSYSMAQIAMDRLYDHPELSGFCRNLKKLPEYQPFYLGILKQYFKTLHSVLKQSVADPQADNIKEVEEVLFEWDRLITHIGLAEDHFKVEAAALQKLYLQLIQNIPMERLSTVISFSPVIRTITGICEYEFKETLRNCLLTACFEALMAYQPVPGKIDAVGKELKRLLAGYAEHFAPRRFFYRMFFETCMGMIGDLTPEIFSNMTQTHKILVRELAILFLEPGNIGQFLLANHHEYARKMLDGLRD